MRRENGTTSQLVSGICSAVIPKKIERPTFLVYALGWLRGLDLNQRPLGYGFNPFWLSHSFCGTHSNVREG